MIQDNRKLKQKDFRKMKDNHNQILGGRIQQAYNSKNCTKQGMSVLTPTQRVRAATGN